MAEGEGTMTKREHLGRMIAAMHVAIVRPLPGYSSDAVKWGKGWQCENCLGMGGDRFHVNHTPSCPFAMIPPEIDIPSPTDLKGRLL